MAEQIQELINKIKTEGIQQANEQSRQIEESAKQKAEKIINEAKKKADDLTASAKSDIEKRQKSSEMAIKQSARDSLITLKKEINAVLKKIVDSKFESMLSNENLFTLISQVTAKYIVENPDNKSAEIKLSKEEYEGFKNSFFNDLQNKLKIGITLKSSDDISGGFTISFDEGKSYFDFTVESLAGFISNFLNPELAELVKESVNEQ